MLGKRYAPEYLANPRNHRTRASLLIEGPEGNLLVDCAPEMRLQLIREEIYDVDAVLITHTHADHVMGMDDLRSICIKTGRPMPVVTLPQHEADIRRIFPYAFREFPPGILVPRFEFMEFREHMSLFGLDLRLFVVRHGSTDTIGLRVNDFAYITDVSEIPLEVMPLLSGLDTLILDAVRLEPHPNHFHLARALEVAREIGARRTFLTHLSHDYDHDVTNAILPANIELAYDGLRTDV